MKKITSRFFNTQILSGSNSVRTKFFPAILLLLIASCNKESDIGIGVQPEEDIIGLYNNDTTTLITYTVLEDSVRTDETPTVVIGKYNDAIFGTATCGLFSQFSIPNNLQNINFGSGAVLDSAVLTLAYAFDFYGDTTVQQSFSVYQMTESINKDSVYYSNRAKSFYPGAIGSLTFDPAPRSKVELGADTVGAHLRIPLDLTWASQIFAQSGGTNLSSNANWLAYMNGLYIAPTATGGGLLYFDLTNDLTGLKLYYHSISDTTSFTFSVGSGTAYYSYYQHDYTSTSIETQLNNPANGMYAETYVQSNAGVKTKIEMPFLSNYLNLGYPIAINKAELVIKGDAAQASDNFPLNTRFFVTQIDSGGTESLLADMFESTAYYGGSINTTTNEYRINIARYMQGILNGTEENNGLYLKEIFAAENGRRAVIGSGHGSAGNLKMYLHLVYTRIN